MSLLRTRALAVAIGGRPIVAGLDLTVAAGECWGLLGLNGSGKTTLLLTLAGLRAPAGGSIELAGRRLADWPARALARERGLMPQDTLDAFPLTALEATLAGRFPHGEGLGWDSPEDLAIARRALAEVGLGAFAGRDCTTLSGGERRRVALATLLAQAPRLYFLDEPANHLDPHHQILLLELLAQRARAGAAVFMTLHDPNLAARYCTHVMLLDRGAACHGPRAGILDAARLTRLYGHRMCAHATPEGEVFVPATGAPADPPAAG